MKPIRRTNIVLIELIIVILFFSLSSVITLQLFVEANRQSKESKITTDLLIKMENKANEFYENPLTIAEQFLSEGWIKEDTVGNEYKFAIYYDKNLESVDKKSGSYYITAILKENSHRAGVFWEMELTAFRKDEIDKKDTELITFPAGKYIGHIQEVEL